MNNSNFSLRFSRSAREAYGHDVQFHNANQLDRRVFTVCAIGAAFLAGLMIGGVL
jgi:hypothetical protein